MKSRGVAVRSATTLWIVFLTILCLGWAMSNDAHATTVTWSNRSATWAPVTSGVYPCACDLDDDKDADLLVFDPLGAFENIGSVASPSWSARPDWIASLDLPAEGDIYGADLGDLDGDDDADLLVSIALIGIIYYENVGVSGSPSWVRNDAYFSYASFVPLVPSIADLDADGDADIAVGGSSSLGSIRNEGTNVTPNWVSGASPFDGITPPGEYIDVCLGDIDGDGDFDLLTAPRASTGALHAYENTGSAGAPEWTHSPSLMTALPQFDDMGGACLVDLGGGPEPDFLTLRMFSSSCYMNEGADTTAVSSRTWGLIKSQFR